MITHTNAIRKLTVVLGLALTTTACQIDFGLPAPEVQDDPFVFDETNDSPLGPVTEKPASDADLSKNPGSERPSGSLPAMAEFVACGSTDAAGVRGSTNPAEPATLPLGQWVSGRLDPDGFDADAEFWQINLKPGSYLIVAESERFDAFSSGLYLYRSNDDGDRGETLLGFSRQRDSARAITRYVTRQDEELRLMVAPRSGIQHYRFGIYRVGEKVPVLRFDNCPKVYKLKLDQQFSKSTGEQSDIADEYMIGTLPKGKYKVSVEMSAQSADRENLGIDLDLLSAGGDAEKFEEVVDANEIATKLFADGEFVVHEEQQVILRLDYSFDHTDYKIKITKSN